MRGHKPDGTSTPSATAGTARAPSPSIRACEPSPRVERVCRQRPLLPAPSAPTRRPSFAVEGAGALTPPPHHAPFRAAHHSADGGRCPSVACSTCSSRSQRAAAPTTARRTACSAVREPARLGHAAPHPAVDATQVDAPGSPVARTSTCTSPSPTTSRWRAALPQALDDGEVPLEFLFSGTWSTRPRGTAPDRDDRLGPDAEYALPVADVARDGGARLPGAAGCGFPRTGSTASGLPLAQQDRELGRTRSTRCCPGTEDSDGPSPRIADAVLYEGYVPRPYRRRPQEPATLDVWRRLPRAHSEQRPAMTRG